MKGANKLRRILLRILTVLFSVILMALVGILLILAQPQPEEKKEAEPQPLLAASPAANITREAEIRSLVEDFPVPVLSFMSGSGIAFVSGSSADVGLPGGFGRVLSLYWQTPEGDPLILQSIYPASAISLLDNGYHFSAVTGPVLFGSESVRMENADTVRVHAATEPGLYVVTVPKSAAPKLSSLSRSMQLFSVKKD